MIELRAVGKRYYTEPGPRKKARGIDALRAVTLSVPAGSALGVVGPNGAGKSTLFSLLLGFIRPTSGSLEIDGMAPRDFTRKRGASYLPERFRLPPGWRVRPSLEALAQLEKLSEPHKRAEEVIAQLGLGEHAGKRISELSRGLLQRVGIAQALLAKRDLVVLDEPTEGLDPIWRLRLRELVAQLRAEGRTMLIASHDLNEVERFVDRVVLLADGAVRDTIDLGRTDDSEQRYRIELRAPIPEVAEIFDQVDDASSRVLLVTVRGSNDLSARLAALLAAGAIVESVTPAGGLEERVRAALRPEDRK
jgi:ABC-type multidrug transport system ATPase subunit